VRIIYWIYLLSSLCLALLPRPCTAWDLASFSPEAISNSPSDETIQWVVATVPFDTGDALASLSSSPESSIPVEEDDGFIRIAVANISPEPAEIEEPVSMIADPLEPVNRAFFHFNDKLYFWVLKPVATGYKAIVPEDGRIGVQNFFSNVTTPVRLVNCLLQANPKCAGTETLRFVLNTTIGVAGLFDPAKKRFNLEKQDKDFGQTLGIWGMGPVFYMNLPILGPSSLRDGLGYAVDASFNPQTYLAAYYVIAEFVNIGGWVLDKVNETSLRIGEYEDLKKSAIDPYIALKDAYHQYRQNKIKAR
jgi:phospholipid-binding lipoprotein MlaA